MFANSCGSIRELGEEIPEDELKAMLDEFDLDGDGESKKLEWVGMAAAYLCVKRLTTGASLSCSALVKCARCSLSLARVV